VELVTLHPLKLLCDLTLQVATGVIAGLLNTML